eukprot:CAMPEP_0115116500 /NCGR_PEP_ID=MMETSP0227-20121206/43329_1 /TAXON_ID=89957 /ORGANISM="Polarella glacialis, Strain CCMP 1383" /LENGTH=560 /DNA_ID=CAMNT_0002517383 /DNA_START=168 /DNA_END=1850 /DNA_ORIENTATION=+
MMLVAIAASLLLAVLASAEPPHPAVAVPAHGPDAWQEDLEAGDECAETADRDCALNALQLQSSKETRRAVVGAGANASVGKMDLRAMGPPATAMAYKGMAWPDMSVTESAHVFAIGDWGGMDGSLERSNGKKLYNIFHMDPGPHPYPRPRWDKDHKTLLCNSGDFRNCFKGLHCPAGCQFVNDVDTKPQQLVAEAFKARAALYKPQYVLNVGDNFYWGGIETKCGSDMQKIHPTTKHQFDQVFETIYDGSDLSDKPWFSVLGNHDWGGRLYANGWDQQIAYTWASKRWVMPSVYWSQHVKYPDQNFSMDYFMIDSNVHDAKPPIKDMGHNICSWYNKQEDDCSVTGGPRSPLECAGWFEALWKEQTVWLEEKLANSEADWKVIVTHFPCGHMAEFYTGLHTKYGLDLLVTGHRHDQELWPAERLGGLTCFVTGGGGGVTSEASPTDTSEWYGKEQYGGIEVGTQYGFFDLTVSKSQILIESINYEGKVVGKAVVLPSSMATTTTTTAAGERSMDLNSTKPEVLSRPNSTEPEVLSRQNSTEPEVRMVNSIYYPEPEIDQE